MQKSLGEFLRELRDDKDVSLRQAAKSVGITAVYLSDIEAGRRFPSDKVIEDLAHYFCVDSDALRQCDNRPPVDEIKRLSSAHPSIGFAFKTVVEDVKKGRVTPEQLVERLKGKGA